MINEENGTAVTISDEVCAQTGITAKWITGDQISVYGYNPIVCNTKDCPSEYAGKQINIHHLKTEFIFDDDLLRSLITESNSIFVTLQNAMKPNKKYPDFVKISRTYRSAIRACLEKLQDVVIGNDDDDDDDNVDVDTNNLSMQKDKESQKQSINDQQQQQQQLMMNYKNYITIFYSVECIWHLCEIFLIDPTPSNDVVPQLLDWIRFHFPTYERKAAECLFMNPKDVYESDSDYMDIIIGLILQGQVDVARTLLRLHSLADSICFKICDDILKSMPIFNIYGGLSYQKFKSQWRYWVTDTESKLSTGCLANEPQLQDIVKLIIGDTEAWSFRAKNSTCWYEYLPGYLFYTNPGCKYFDLGSLVDVWLRLWATANDFNIAQNHFKHLDRVIFSVMSNEMHHVLRDIQNMCDNQWFVTHLTDLLYHCNQLHITGETQKDIGNELRQSLLFDFGCTLMARQSLWIIGLDYLENCTDGLGAMEILLPKIPIKTERQALKMINIAKNRGLNESIEREICQIQAMQSLRNQRYGNALEWSLRSHDNVFVTSIADIFLKHYSKTGKMLCPDVLVNIGAKMFISPRLVFLKKYFDFHQYYERHEFEEAAKLLVNLLDSKISPEYFWLSLLADTIPLLESGKCSSKDNFTILHYLEGQLIPLIEKHKKQLITDNDLELQLLYDCRIENIDEMVKIIRLACARNLSRCNILENSMIPN